MADPSDGVAKIALFESAMGPQIGASIGCRRQ
jgi:hypothetical protein